MLTPELPDLAHVCLQVNPPFTHSVVNHSENFRDPVTGDHTNACEGQWSQMKKKWVEQNGVQHTFIPSYLDEFQWRQVHEPGPVHDHWRTLEILLTQIGQWYRTPQAN